MPRGTYRCADGEWVAISTSAESVAQRVMALIGLADDPRLASFADGSAHRELVDDTLAAWVAERDLADGAGHLRGAHAAAAPVYSMGDILADPHLAARGPCRRWTGCPCRA